jgi:hypothetical protein
MLGEVGAPQPVGSNTATSAAASVLFVSVVVVFAFIDRPLRGHRYVVFACGAIELIYETQPDAIAIAVAAGRS